MKRFEEKPYLEHVKGNTYCIALSYARIPLYLLGDGKAIMLDSGMERSWDVILQLLEQENLRITSVLTTHSHPDHVGNHINLQQRFGSKLYMSPFTAAIYASPMNMTAMGHGFISYRKLVGSLGDPIHTDHLIDVSVPSVAVDGVTFSFVHTPGHAAEHLAFITPDNVAYLGDAVLSEQLLQSLRLPYCSCIEPDLESKEALKQLNCDRYIVAHNGVYDQILPLIQQNQDWMQEKAQIIQDLCDDYYTIDELAQKFIMLTDAKPDAIRTVNGIRRNVSAFVEYLVDVERLELQAKDGIMKFKSKIPVV